jgi:Dolichyl-phosphate-mannose-protein mannosyltransferase
VLGRQRELRLRIVPRSERAGLLLVVFGSALLNGLLALPIRRPRVFGDELIYWLLGRAFAWSGSFSLRGGAAPRYGVIYPALLAIPQRIGSDQQTAYAVAQGLNAFLFSLAAVPAYAIALRVVSRRAALFAAALSVVLPSCIYTSNVFTENAFYPIFVTTALLMLRALERPSISRQLLVVSACGVAFFTRAQAVVLLPSYLLAALLIPFLGSAGSRCSALAASLRRQAPSIAALMLAGVGALVIRGPSVLGPYHVLVTSYRLRPLVHWTLANAADMEIYLGVVPAAAFLVLLLSRSSSPSLRRLTILTACLACGLLATVAVLGASKYGLGRVHERNVFYLAPLVLISFLAWLEAGMPRPRRIATGVAAVVTLLPLTIPRSAVPISGEDGLATIVWNDLPLSPRAAIIGMVLVAAVAAAVFLAGKSWKPPVALCLAALLSGIVLGERHAIDTLQTGGAQWRDGGWIDRVVGSNANVVVLWATTHTGPQAVRIGGSWADEFFNRSVNDVASADGPLPDGISVEPMTIGPGGCLRTRLSSHPRFAVLETRHPLTGAVIAVSPSGRSVLYRLEPSDGCLAHLAR